MSPIGSCPPFNRSRTSALRQKRPSPLGRVLNPKQKSSNKPGAYQTRIKHLQLALSEKFGCVPSIRTLLDRFREFAPKPGQMMVVP
jgi:hypothetical protein